MITIKSEIAGISNDIYEYLGNSSDTKPEGNNGDKFYEIDTDKEYMYDKKLNRWYKLNPKGTNATRFVNSVNTTKNPTKNEYRKGESFNLSGLTVAVRGFLSNRITALSNLNTYSYNNSTKNRFELTQTKMYEDAVVGRTYTIPFYYTDHISGYKMTASFSAKCVQ